LRHHRDWKSELEVRAQSITFLRIRGGQFWTLTGGQNWMLIDNAALG